MNRKKSPISHSKSSSACCPQNEIVLDEGCTSFDYLNANTTILNLQGSYASLTFYLERNPTPSLLPGTFRVFSSTGISNITVTPGASQTATFKNVGIIQFRPFNIGTTSYSGRVCYRIYKKQPIESSTSCESRCCSMDEPTVIIDNFCDIITTGILGTNRYWQNFTPVPIETTAFLYPENKFSATITINRESGTPITSPILPGESRQFTVPDATSIDITQVGGNEAVIIGTLGTTVYRKIY